MALPESPARRILERYVRWSLAAMALLVAVAAPFAYRVGDLFVLLLIPAWALPVAVAGFVALALYLLVVHSAERG